MKPYHLAGLSFFGSIAAAYDTYEPQGHIWFPAKPQDSRSPCPGLNALANHGWLPRSGKNLDLADIQSAIDGAYNFQRDALDSVVQQVFDFNLSTTATPSTTFNLEDLKKHDAIEIDGSLSRNDFYFGDDLHFDPAIWADTAKYLGLYNHFDVTGKFVTIESAGKARALRVADAKKANPTFNASVGEMGGSPGTTALYLTVLWDEKINATYKDWVRVFFEQERLPYLEGYQRPSQRTTQESFTETVMKVASVGA